MKKIVLSGLLLVSLGLAFVFITIKYQQTNRPTSINFEGTNFILTEEPYEGAAPEKRYHVKKKIERYALPEKHLESNFLDVQTEIFPSSSDSTIIYYMKEQKFYVAREDFSQKIN